MKCTAVTVTLMRTAITVVFFQSNCLCWFLLNKTEMQHFTPKRSTHISFFAHIAVSPSFFPLFFFSFPLTCFLRFVHPIQPGIPSVTPRSMINLSALLPPRIHHVRHRPTDGQTTAILYRSRTITTIRST